MSNLERWSDKAFIQLMTDVIGSEPSADELAQIVANADYRSEQQSMMMEGAQWEQQH